MFPYVIETLVKVCEYCISSNKCPGAYAKGWALIQGKALNRGGHLLNILF